MLDRIKLILEENRLQPSSFADAIQVSRGTISHILSGRNNPRKDTIDKILKTFPDISKEWFYSGEGPMYKRRIVAEQASASGQLDLFNEKQSVELNGSPQEREYSLKKGDKTPEKKTNPIAIQEINISNNISKKIDKIIIFFNDKTFMTFISEE